MQETARPRRSSRSLEQILAIVGALVCLTVSIRIWQVASSLQPMWPFPGLYLVEMLLVSAVGALGIVMNDSRPPPLSATLAWVAIGVLSAFALLGAWSIGAFYWPVVVLLLASAVLHHRRRRRNLAPHLGLAALAALAQGALMAAVIALFR
jgi:hypothetical protein